MTDFDDPNREAVGLAPIWTGAGEPPPEGDPDPDDDDEAPKTTRKKASSK